MLNKILKITNIVINIALSLVMGVFGAYMYYFLVWMLFINKEPNAVFVPIWLKIILFIILNVVLGGCFLEMYKQNKLDDKRIELYKKIKTTR